MDAEVKARFDEVGERFDAVDQRFGRLDQVDKRFDGEDELATVHERIDGLGDDMRQRFRAVNDRLGGFAA